MECRQRAPLVPRVRGGEAPPRRGDSLVRLAAVAALLSGRWPNALSGPQRCGESATRFDFEREPHVLAARERGRERAIEHAQGDALRARHARSEPRLRGVHRRRRGFEPRELRADVDREVCDEDRETLGG